MKHQLRRQKLIAAGLIVGAFVATALFQNCAPFRALEGDSQGSSATRVLPEADPVAAAVQAVYFEKNVAYVSDGTGIGTSKIVSRLKREADIAVEYEIQDDAGLTVKTGKIVLPAGQQDGVEVRVDFQMLPTKALVATITRVGDKALCSGICSNNGLNQTFSLYKIDSSKISKGYSQVAISDTHACAVRIDGGIDCWGSNEKGQLGLPVSTGSPYPVRVGGLTNAKKVVVASGGSCALLTDSNVVCWGSDGGTVANSITTIGSVKFEDLISTTSGIAVDGTLLVFPKFLSTPVKIENSISNTSATPVANETKTVDVQVKSTLNNYPPVAANCIVNSPTSACSPFAFFCAIGKDTNVYCWGYNGYGALGLNLSTKFSAAPVKIPNVANAVQIIGSGFGVCALEASGRVKCWGGSSSILLGPTEVAGLPNLVELAPNGSSRFCGRTSDLKVFCFIPTNGRFAENTALAGAIKLQSDACALTATSYVCDYAQVGIAGLRVVHIDDARDLSTDGFFDGPVCFLKSDSSIWCSGSTQGGELGGLGIGSTQTPRVLAGIKTAESVVNSCALLADKTVTCWGDIAAGSGARLRTFNELVNVKKIVGYDGKTFCALLDDSQVFCYLATGINTKTYGFERIDLANGATDLVGSGGSYCGLKTDGTVVCWDSNKSFSLPHALPGLAGVSRLIANDVVQMIAQFASGNWQAFSPRTNSVNAGWSNVPFPKDSIGMWATDRFFLSESGDLRFLTAQVTNGSSTSMASDLPPPFVVPKLKLMSGTSYFCGLSTSGGVGCAPSVSVSARQWSAYAPIVGLDHATSIVATSWDACAVQDGEIYCWSQKANSTAPMLGRTNTYSQPALPISTGP